SYAGIAVCAGRRRIGRLWRAEGAVVCLRKHVWFDVFTFYLRESTFELFI
ncbi:MAG: hypothetical protein ACI944_001660, partial [Natronomonas sp.]